MDVAGFRRTRTAVTAMIERGEHAAINLRWSATAGPDR